MLIKLMNSGKRHFYIEAITIAVGLSFPISALRCSGEDFTSSLPSPTYEVSTESAKSLFKHGNHLYKEGDLDQADKLFKEVIDRDPSNVTAHFNRGVIAEQKNDLSSALRDYQNALQLKPHDREIQSAVKELSAKLPAKAVGEIIPFSDPENNSNAGSANKKVKYTKVSHHNSHTTQRLARRGIGMAIRLSLRHW